MNRRCFGLMVAVAAGSFTTGSLALADQNEVVAYRLGNRRAMHLDDKKTAQQYEASLKKLGCAVRVDWHAGHFDLVYSCPDWRESAFETHSAAHRWEAWLKSLGFETKHKH